MLAGGNTKGRNRDGADELGSKGVVVLDLELEVEDGVGHGNVEVLIPLRVLGVRDDTRTRHGGLWDNHSDVRVAGDDSAVVLLQLLISGVGGATGGAGVAAGEAAAEALRCKVHVR